VGAERGRGARERPAHRRRRQRAPPIYSRDKSFSSSSKLLSLLAASAAATAPPFQEACCTELPPCGRERKLTTTIVDPKAFSARGTQPITYQKDRLASRGKGGNVRGGEEIKEVRGRGSTKRAVGRKSNDSAGPPQHCMLRA